MRPKKEVRRKKQVKDEDRWGDEDRWTNEDNSRPAAKIEEDDFIMDDEDLPQNYKIVSEVSLGAKKKPKPEGQAQAAKKEEKPRDADQVKREDRPRKDPKPRRDERPKKHQKAEDYSGFARSQFKKQDSQKPEEKSMNENGVSEKPKYSEKGGQDRHSKANTYRDTDSYHGGDRPRGRGRGRGKPRGSGRGRGRGRDSYHHGDDTYSRDAHSYAAQGDTMSHHSRRSNRGRRHRGGDK